MRGDRESSVISDQSSVISDLSSVLSGTVITAPPPTFDRVCGPLRTAGPTSSPLVGRGVPTAPSGALDRAWPLLLLLLAILIPWSDVLGAERFPPPEFEPGTYVMPATTTPPARIHLMEYVDMALLLGSLSLASYLVLVKRLRKQILWLMAFSLLYFGFVRKGCVCPVGSTQDVALALFNDGYRVPLSIVVFFLAPLIFTLFFGRTFCAAVCPLGAMQDIVLWRPVKVRPWVEQALGVIPFIYLGAAVLFAATGTAFIICEYDPFVSFFRRSGSFKMLSIGAGFLVAGMFLGRPYCRFLCPYGALLGILSRFSRWNVTLTPTDCIRCQICDNACPYGAIAEPAEAAAQASSPPPSKARLAALILLVPLLIGGGGWLGNRLGIPFSRMHPTVTLAEQVISEDAGKIKEPTDASKAFRQTGKPVQELFADALRIRQRFDFASLLLGGFVGLVIGVKLLSIQLPRKREIFEPDPSNCLACGRCYSYCPKELVRVKKLEKAKATAPTVARQAG